MESPSLPPVRQYGFPEEVSEPFWLSDNDIALKSPGYSKAKGGDEEAAASLVWDLATEFMLGIRDRLPSDVIFVAPHAREAAGDNAIPHVFATACSIVAQENVDTEIVQITRVFHTGADPMERMNLRAELEGQVRPGTRYILTDDVINMGGTLAEPANHIRCGRGIVAGVVVPVNAGRAKHLQPARKVIRELERRYGNEITKIFGIIPAALTANEANYLIGFRSADEIRNRVSKAEKETDFRLRSKGIGRQARSRSPGKEGAGTPQNPTPSRSTHQKPIKNSTAPPSPLKNWSGRWWRVIWPCIPKRHDP